MYSVLVSPNIAQIVLLLHHSNTIFIVEGVTLKEIDLIEDWYIFLHQVRLNLLLKSIWQPDVNLFQTSTELQIICKMEEIF